ncbi:Hint domain-containing protein [Ovoidimarina sediminis]|uniref:Hint domain-containing protein n=1 Tax=Ovoidimarina sediminis TaxID=3079856 RepID=UPI002910B76A|nr:Hint domain-containing protein [Rhodophyticola sp. MJ-SS7]MDU8944464.1 Hint domain-containing protein [Rhodophyticola sp. MJ-SS7]
MATIIVTEPDTVVEVDNGDRVVIDIPGGGTVTLVAADPQVTNFQVDFTDDTVSDTLRIDLSTFANGDVQVQLNDYDTTDRVELIGGSGTIDPSRSDQYLFDFTGADGNLYQGRIRLKDQGEKDFGTNPSPIIICFATGTIIDTDLGPTPVEALTVGTLVQTLDRGLQPVRWIGHRHLSRQDLRAFPHLRPVTITAGALGGGLPWSDLTVSPQHRIRIADWRAELYFGEPEVLVPAKALIDGRTIVEADVEDVTYWHLLFDRHELLLSNGLPSESLHPGQMSLMALDDIQNGTLPPDLAEPGRPLARPALRVREARAVGASAA